VIAGGAKMDSDEDIFGMVEGALAAGAAGISIGRNAFQHKACEKMVAALCKMVHNNAGVKEAIEILGK
jgi:DhnA family fructose-bisphosphate aldolase class Ia